MLKDTTQLPQSGLESRPVDLMSKSSCGHMKKFTVLDHDTSQTCEILSLKTQPLLNIAISDIKVEYGNFIKNSTDKINVAKRSIILLHLLSLFNCLECSSSTNFRAKSLP